MLRGTALDEKGCRQVVTNDLGEYALLSTADFDLLRGRELLPAHPRYHDLLAKGFISRPSRGGRGLEAAVLRTRKSSALEGPSLHIFVVTLRCDHACAYCQVSRAALSADGYDMSFEAADAAVDRVFESPANSVTVEFQGGEPTVRFDLIRHIVEKIEHRKVNEGKDVHFSLVSTLHHMTEDYFEFCRDHKIHISTSIDGAANIHNRQRHNPTRDSWQRTVSALEHGRSIVGHDGIVAMPTVTKAALLHPKQIVDTYLDLGFKSLFLRPMSAYGFAGKTRRAIGYDMAEYLAFYEQVLDYLLELNAQGTEIVETYSSILLRHIFTPFGTNYVDLRSPAGAGLSVLVYNYDGLVYPADEARMAAETGDKRFALGRVDQSLDELLSSPAMQWLATGSVAERLPGCSECAFVPFCGADPVYHAVFQGNPVGRRDDSEFCSKHLGMFRILFGRIADSDAEAMRTFQAWAFQCARADIREVGFIEQ